MYAIRSYYAVTHGPVWALNHRAEAKGDAIDCSACHEQSDCLECHNVITSYSIHYTKLYDVISFKVKDYVLYYEGIIG